MPRDRKDIDASLVSKGFTPRRKGKDHDFFFLSHRNLTRAVYTKLSRGKQYKTYGDELLSRMSRQLQITRQQLDQLIDCTMDGAQYITALEAQGIIRSDST